MRALSVMLPADKFDKIAGRSDVVGISPNRRTARTASTLEQATGVTKVRIGNSNTAYTGCDGAGVGIAIRDSGIWRRHMHFGGQANTRVLRSVNFMRDGAGDAEAVGLKSWAAGMDASAGLYRAVRRWAATSRRSSGSRLSPPTRMATAPMSRRSPPAPTPTRRWIRRGMAPKANLFDVKVLDDNGFGQLSDVLAGIDWVLYYAKTYNIRVINLSLAADSTESHLTDPLAIAVRSATAAGIGRFGTISSPGHEASVITVGSANVKGTAARTCSACAAPRAESRRAASCRAAPVLPTFELRRARPTHGAGRVELATGNRSRPSSSIPSLPRGKGWGGGNACQCLVSRFLPGCCRSLQHRDPHPGLPPSRGLQGGRGRRRGALADGACGSLTGPRSAALPGGIVFRERRHRPQAAARGSRRARRETDRCSA